jgi:HSP20 family molecular chaperone IbpA
MLSEEKAVLSAKWRRYKKRSKRFQISKDFNSVKNRKTPKPFRIKNLRTKRGAYPYKYNLLRTYRRRKWKEPEPLIDVFEEKDKIIVVAEFAGFKRDNLKIHVKDQRLTLSAEASNRRYYKSLNLPKIVIPDTLRTSYKNGVLEIRFKKIREEKPIDKVAG